MITSEQIEDAKRNFKYEDPKDVSHEHDDCIRIAYEWLDAQKKNKTVAPIYYIALKHVIEKWGGRYVSQSDVEVAAFMHPEIKGKYPTFNLSRRLVLPKFDRLSEIKEANTMPSYRERLDRSMYKQEEA